MKSVENENFALVDVLTGFRELLGAAYKLSVVGRKRSNAQDNRILMIVANAASSSTSSSEAGPLHREWSSIPPFSSDLRKICDFSTCHSPSVEDVSVR